MYRSLSLTLAAIICISCGCANEPPAPMNAIAVAAEPQQQTDEKGGIGGKMADLVEQAKSKAPSLDDVKKMLNDAGDATGQTTDDTMKWVNEIYKSLSDRGMTSAKSAGDWVAEDWSSMYAWQYKVVSVDSKQIADNPEVLAEKLNESGEQRWECFHVSDGIDGTMFYMKRRKKSYLKHVPLKDMMRLIPLLDNDNG